VTLVVESLDDRVVLSAPSAIGAHAAAAVGVTRASSQSAGLIRRFDAALERINGLVNRGLDHFNGLVNNQIGGVDAAIQTLNSQSMPGISNDPIVNDAREAALKQVTIGIVNPLDRFISRFDTGLNRFTRAINDQFAQLGRQFNRADTALRSAVIAVTANVESDVAAAGGRWLGELQAGRANLQDQIDSALTAIASDQASRSQRMVVTTHGARSGMTTSPAGIAPIASGATTAAQSGTFAGAGISPFAFDPFGMALDSGNGAGTDMTDIGEAMFL
jgi:hypothetical protein